MVRSGRKGGWERTHPKREEWTLSWAAPAFHSSASWSPCWRVHRHCHNQIHENSNCKFIVHAHSYCTAPGHVFQLKMITFWRARSSTCGWRETQEKTPSACANTGAVSHGQAQMDQCHRKLLGGSASSAWHIPTGSTHSLPERSHPASSDYRTQVPTETGLVGTVTAAKYKMEMAQERMAPAAPRERLRS